MKTFICMFIFSFAVIGGYAQMPPIMVCNATGTSCTTYTNIDTAITNAVAGNYIYLPGWSFPIHVHINKELHIIGAGHYPDSTYVTGVSQITNNLNFGMGSDNSTIDGVYFTGTIYHYTTGAADTINYIKITRCNFSAITASYTNALFNNILIRSCVSRSTLTPYCINSTISNNIIGPSGIGTVSYSEISNNIIYGSISNGSSCNYDVVKNNIVDSFASTTTYSSCSGCSLYNNITKYSSLYLTATTSETGTIANISTSSLFVSPSTYGFDYTKNYNLTTGCSGIGYGTDGTDVGIYGGSMPYTDGGVPANPHFFYKNVGGVTDSTGSLPVHFKVRSSY